jgi:23S rRNA (guanine745-N1)-methyltransferase
MRENNLFKCPVCNLALNKSERIFACFNNHCFDMSKDGYLNLLLAKEKKSRNPGDNKEMLLNRRDFLNKGFYSALLQMIFEIIQEHLNSQNLNSFNILDIGCGEGYYTCGINDLLKELNLNTAFWGVDISKEAIQLAAKRKSSVNFIVGNAHFLPFFDKKFDIIFSIFSPLSGEEINRIASDNSILIIAGPGKRHLFELIELIYDQPKLHQQNSQIKIPAEFKQIDEKELNFFLDLKDKADISNLFSMTPYFWQAPIDKQKQIFELEKLSIEINFNIKIFQKKI